MADLAQFEQRVGGAMTKNFLILHWPICACNPFEGVRVMVCVGGPSRHFCGREGPAAVSLNPEQSHV